MSISIACSGCGKQYTLEDRFAGKKLRCKQCGAVTSIPAAEEPDPFAAMEELEKNRETWQDKLHAQPAPARPAPMPMGPPPTPAAPAAVAAAAVPAGAPMRAQVQYATPSRGLAASAAPVEGATPALILLYILASVVVFIRLLVVYYGIPEGSRGDERGPGIITTMCITQVVFFFAIVSPAVMLGVFIGSRIMGVKMPDGSYIKSAGIAATPAVILVLIGLLPSNIVLLIMGIVAVVPVAFYVLMYSFGFDFVKALVSFTFAAMFYVIGWVVAIVLLGAVVAGALMGSRGSGGPTITRLTPPVISNNGGGSARYTPPVPQPPVDPEAFKVNSLRQRAMTLNNVNVKMATREDLLRQLNPLREEAKALKVSRPNDSEVQDILRILDEIEQKIVAIPSEKPDESIYVDAMSSGPWNVIESFRDALGDEVSFKEFKLRPAKETLLDLRSSEKDADGLIWRTNRAATFGQPSTFGQMAITSIARANPRQKRPWIVSRGFQLQRAGTEKLFAINGPEASVSVGEIGGITFTRVASKAGDAQPGESLAMRQRWVKYVALDGNNWVVITITCGDQDAQTFELLEAAVRTVRRAGNEAKVDPFAPDRIALRLVDSPEAAATVLRRQGAAAEAAVIPLLQHEKPQVRRAAAEVLSAVGTEKSLPTLRELAKSKDREVAKSARAAWRKLAPKEMDEVAECLLDMETGGVFEKRDALEALAKCKADERREKIAPMLEAMVAARDSMAFREQAGKALAVWANSKTATNILPLLTRETDFLRRHVAMDVLGELKDKRTVRPVLSWIVEDGDKTVEALSKMGPVAEDEVLVFLRTPPPMQPMRRQAAIINAVKVLEAVGTSKSARLLGQMAQSRDLALAEAARQAIQAIKARTPEQPANEKPNGQQSPAGGPG